MTLTLVGHDRRFAVEQAVLNYFPKRDGGQAVSRLSPSGRLASAMIEYNGRTARGRAWVKPGVPPDGALRMAFYRAAKQLSEPPPWGALTGIRPAKKALEIIDKNLPCEPELIRRYEVSPARARMAADCAQSSAALRDRLQENDAALYIGIPFCPTRCAYCSFVSSAVGKDYKLLSEYLDTLRDEMTCAGETAESLGLRIRSIYWGGGTPAVLSVGEITETLLHLCKPFNLNSVFEHTFEAGRPDAVTDNKMAALRSLGVTRVSVNPQTLSQEALGNIGRSHTAEQFFTAFAQAREAGFDLINTDLIAGLPGESAGGFLEGLSRVIILGPENITIHTLAKKRGSRAALEGTAGGGADTVRAMLDGAGEALRTAGYRPYYLYRQKFTEGGFENTGWAKPGTECAYNIMMMEELCTVLSLGAGGVTKIVRGKRIERLFHPKYPSEYIGRRDTLEERWRTQFTCRFNA